MHHPIIFAVSMTGLAIVGIVAAIRTFENYESKLEVGEMNQDNQAQADAAAKAAEENQAQADAAAKAAEEKAEIEKSHPTRFNGHEHKFTSGLAPGGKNLRICTVEGCGYTEGL